MSTPEQEWLLGAPQESDSFWDTPLRRATTRSIHPVHLAAALQQLAALLRTGANAADAMTTTANMAPSSALAGTLTAAAAETRRGLSVPTALASTRMLPSAAVAMVALADITGNVPQALELAADHVRRTWQSARLLRWALASPAITVAALLGLFAVLFTAVTPALTAATDTAALPAYTVALLWVGRAVPLLAAGVAAAALTYRFVRARTGRRAQAVRAVLVRTVPGAAAARAATQEVTWARVAAQLLRAGVPLAQVAACAALVTDTAHHTTAWGSASREAARGADAGTLAAHLPTTAGAALQAVAVAGQRSGTLPEQLEAHADRAAAAVADHAHATTALTTPVAVAGSAALIVMFCLGVLLPTLNLLH